jgi:hypothetical protein
MKPSQFVQLSIVSSLACVLSISAHATEVPQPNASSSTIIQIAQSKEVVASRGTFVAAEKPTSGNARIVVENGQRYLVFDAAFKTSDQGPDLHVVLDPAEKPPMQYQNQTQYINLGKLRKFSGEQRYPIPAAIDLTKFKSVAVWCRMANATFGYAPLRPTSSALR